MKCTRQMPSKIGYQPKAQGTVSADESAEESHNRVYRVIMRASSKNARHREPAKNMDCHADVYDSRGWIRPNRHAWRVPWTAASAAGNRFRARLKPLRSVDSPYHRMRSIPSLSGQKRYLMWDIIGWRSRIPTARPLYDMVIGSLLKKRSQSKKNGPLGRRNLRDQLCEGSP
jgi:hypothetical protein